MCVCDFVRVCWNVCVETIMANDSSVWICLDSMISLTIQFIPAQNAPNEAIH